jgi:hypothetical protein
MWRLIYPLRYFRLDNKEKKRIDFWASLGIAALIFVPFLFIPGASFFRPNGFLDKLLTLTSALTGFYVAALVAAATFNHPDLDNVIKSGPIALITKGDDGNFISELLTRREFICTIFAYLAFSAFIISIICAACVGLSGANLGTIKHWPYIGKLFSYGTWTYLRGALIIVISLGIGHLVVATGLGIYYMMDRLYRHDRKITTKKNSSADAA